LPPCKGVKNQKAPYVQEEKRVGLFLTRGRKKKAGNWPRAVGPEIALLRKELAPGSPGGSNGNADSWLKGKGKKKRTFTFRQKIEPREERFI